MPRSLVLLAFLALSAPGFVSPSPVKGAAPTEEEVRAVAEAHGMSCEARDFEGSISDVQCRRDAGPNGEPPTVVITYAPPGHPMPGASITAFGMPPMPQYWLDVAIELAELACDASPVAAAAAMPSLDGEPSGADTLGTCHLGFSSYEVGDGTQSFDIQLAIGGEPDPAEPPAEPIEPPPDWSPWGRSTYAGTWTVAHYANDSDFGEPEATVGDSVPGTLTLDCIGEDGHCEFTSTWEDGLRWAVTIEVVGDGAGRFVDETHLDGNCPDGQLYRDTYEATWDATGASASVATVHEPRTCEWDENSLVFSSDITWSFEGSLAEYVAPPSEDLAAFLASYGLTCSDDGTECILEIEGDEGTDATYRVLTEHDEAGEISAIEAIVESLDESMPSDAFGFLRGVAQRAPMDATDGVLAWLDTAVGGAGPEQYADDGWTATWASAPIGDGETWTLAMVREEAAQEPEPSATPRPAAGEGEVPAAGGAVAAPGESRPFAASVPEPTQISTDPTVLLQSGLLAALLVFLMPFPSQLFNSTLETHEDEVRRWFRLDRVGGIAVGIGAFWTSWPGVMVFTLLAALLYGFLDPGFGFELGSLATVLGMLIGIVLVTAAFATPALLAHRRDGGRPRLKVVPASLMVGIACVLLSRVTGFQPGYLYGLLVGLVFARELSAAEEGRTTAIGAVLMLAVSLIAWLGLGVLPDDDAFGLAVLRTALAALMVAGLEGVAFGLLPMRFLPGEPLYSWNRIIWGALLGIGAFAFFHILINPASGYLSDTSRTPLLTVLGLLVGFSAVSVAFWGWFRFRASASTSPEAGGSG